MLSVTPRVYVPVLPAQAGVIPHTPVGEERPVGTPRASGGDPSALCTVAHLLEYSPRKRG